MSPEGAPTSCNVDIAVPCKACYDSDDDDRAWGDQDEEAMFDVFETQTTAEADICHSTGKLSTSSVSVPTAAAAVVSAASTRIKSEHDVDITADDDEMDEWKLDLAHPSKMKEAKKYGPEEFLLLSPTIKKMRAPRQRLLPMSGTLADGAFSKDLKGRAKSCARKCLGRKTPQAVESAKPAADDDDDAEGAKSKTDGGAESAIQTISSIPSFFDEGHQLRTTRSTD